MRRMLVHVVFALVIFTVWVVAYRAACESRLAAAQDGPRSVFGACESPLSKYVDDDDDNNENPSEIGDVRRPVSTAPATRVTPIACPGGK